MPKERWTWILVAIDILCRKDDFNFALFLSRALVPLCLDLDLCLPYHPGLRDGLDRRVPVGRGRGRLADFVVAVPWPGRQFLQVPVGI